MGSYASVRLSVTKIQTRIKFLWERRGLVVTVKFEPSTWSSKDSDLRLYANDIVHITRWAHCQRQVAFFLTMRKTIVHILFLFSVETSYK